MLWYFPAGHWTAVVPWRWSRWVWLAGLGCGGGGSRFGVSVIPCIFAVAWTEDNLAPLAALLLMQGTELDEMVFFTPS